MNWEALGAIAELTAAIGVIASLIYLAKQISTNSDNVAQNTKALISDRDVSSTESALAIMRSHYQDPKLAALIMKGSLDAEPLTDLELFRYRLALASMFESHQTFFLQHLRGAVSEELWNYYSQTFERYLRSPGIVKWWRRNKSPFYPLFADYIDQKIPDAA